MPPLLIGFNILLPQICSLCCTTPSWSGPSVLGDQVDGVKSRANHDGQAHDCVPAEGSDHTLLVEWPPPLHLVAGGLPAQTCVTACKLASKSLWNANAALLLSVRARAVCWCVCMLVCVGVGVWRGSNWRIPLSSRWPWRSARERCTRPPRLAASGRPAQVGALHIPLPPGSCMCRASRPRDPVGKPSEHVLSSRAEDF